MFDYVYYGTIGFMSGGLLGFFATDTKGKSVFKLQLKHITNVWAICGAGIGILYVHNGKKPILYKLCG